MSTPPPVIAPNTPNAIDIDNGGTRAFIEVPKNGEFPTFKVPFSMCDGNGVLKDVLDNIADPDLVKQELEFEAKNNMTSAAIYKRRLNLIKTLVGTK